MLLPEMRSGATSTLPNYLFMLWQTYGEDEYSPPVHSKNVALLQEQ